jgi:hypothetical protein
VEHSVDLAEFWTIGEVSARLGPPPIDVAKDVGRNEEHGSPGYGIWSPAPGVGGTVSCMESRRVPASEWRQMSDEEQRAMIRAGITEVEDLPEEFRREVEDMLAQHRSLPRSA